MPVAGKRHEAADAAHSGLARKARHARVCGALHRATGFQIPVLRYLTDQDLEKVQRPAWASTKIKLAAIGELAGALPTAPKPVTAAS